MNQEHDLAEQVYAAKKNTLAADALVRQYLPFIKSETAKFIHRFPKEGEDDELSIAMFAFHEAVLKYQKIRGAFLKFAAVNIKNRLIDYTRRENRHMGIVSLDETEEEDSRSMLEKLQDQRNEIQEKENQSAAKDEILQFSKELSKYGLSLTDISDNCPRQNRTLSACHQALSYAKQNPDVFEKLLGTKRLPISLLAEGSGVDRKTLERHRKYIIAILLAYTNGFEIIRGHLKQVAPAKGGRKE